MNFKLTGAEATVLFYHLKKNLVVPVNTPPPLLEDINFLVSSDISQQSIITHKLLYRTLVRDYYNGFRLDWKNSAAYALFTAAEALIDSDPNEDVEYYTNAKLFHATSIVSQTTSDPLISLLKTSPDITFQEAQSLIKVSCG